MIKFRGFLTLVAGFLLLSSCSQDQSGSENEITKCQKHCSEKGLFMDYDQTQLTGRCICDVERIDD